MRITLNIRYRRHWFHSVTHQERAVNNGELLMSPASLLRSASECSCSSLNWDLLTPLASVQCPEVPARANARHVGFRVTKSLSVPLRHKASSAFMKWNVSPHHQRKCFSSALNWSLSKQNWQWIKLIDQARLWGYRHRGKKPELHLNSNPLEHGVRGKVFQCCGELEKMLVGRWLKGMCPYTVSP